MSATITTAAPPGLAAHWSAQARGLQDILPGYGDPVHQAQRIFRQLLELMAAPGRIGTLPRDILAALAGPGGGSGSAALRALLLSLLDGETTTWIDPQLPESDQLVHYLRFHCSVTMAPVATAAFCISASPYMDGELFRSLNSGSDLVPEASATLVLLVDTLAECSAPGSEKGLRPASPGCCMLLQLGGPGIREQRWLEVSGPEADFWRARQAQEADYPRGVDLVLLAGDRLTALPRSVSVQPMPAQSGAV